MRGPYAVVPPPVGVGRRVDYSMLGCHFAGPWPLFEQVLRRTDVRRSWSWDIDARTVGGARLLHMHLLWYADAGRAGGGSTLQLFDGFLGHGVPPSYYSGPSEPEEVAEIAAAVRGRLPTWRPPEVPPSSSEPRRLRHAAELASVDAIGLCT